MLRSVIPLLAALLVSGCVTGPVRQSEVLPQLRRLNAELEDAHRSGDAVRAGLLFTDDAIVSPTGLADVRGRSEIVKLLEQLFRAMDVPRYSLQPNEVDVFGNMLFERGSYEWRAGLKGQPPKLELGRYSLVRQRGPDGVWRIHRFIENTSGKTP